MSGWLRQLWNSSPRDLVERVSRKFRTPTETPSTCSVQFVGCLSTGRVGSKTLAELGRIAIGEAAQHEPEPHLFGLGKAAFNSSPANSFAPSPDLLAGVEACRESSACNLASSNGTYLETSPQVTFLAPAIKQIFPKAKFIHVVRHPVDVIRSGMRRNWYTGSGHDRWRIVPVEGEHAERWPNMTPFEKNVWLWTATNQWIVNYFETLEPSEQTTIKSEDLFSGSKELVASVFDFLGVPKPDDSSVKGVLGQNLNAQRSGTFPTGEGWSDEQKATLRRIAGDVMDRFGYSLD